MSIRRLVGTPATSDDGTSPPLAPAHDLGDHTPHGDSRRQFVRKLGLGSAAAVGAIALPGAVLASAAAAQSSTDAEALSTNDAAIITYLETLEGAAVEVYKAVVVIPTLLPGELTLLQSYLRHHQAHVTALGTARAAEDGDVATPDATVASDFTAQIASDSAASAVYAVLYKLESQLAATFLDAIGSLEDAVPVGVVAGIGPVDGQQAFQLGKDVGADIDDILPIFQTTDGSFPLPAA